MRKEKEDQSEFLMELHIWESAEVVFCHIVRRNKMVHEEVRCFLKKDQSQFPEERRKVCVCSEACRFSTLQEDTEMAHGEELMEIRRLNRTSFFT